MVKRADGLTQFNAPAEAAGGVPEDSAKQDAARAETSEKSRKSVYMYIATLFLVVLLFTLLSYFVQQRNNSEIGSLHEKYATAEQNIENLQTTNLQLQSESDTDKKQINELQGQMEDLNKQITDIRQQWQDDVQSIQVSDQAAYNALLEKYNALQEKYTELAKKNGIMVTD